MRFVDTNVLLYAVSRDSAEAAKAAVARELLGGRDLALSVQVLHEFYVQATRATRTDPLSHRQAVDLIVAFARFPVQEGTLALTRAALSTRDRFQLSFWDAAIIEAARLLECPVVLSEDLNDGQDYGGVMVVNPFA
ncbi:MAG TPA: PIN domain-containing protein [Candidatus Ruania gallistercoris]|uniref:Ribonuclease VapC n=1 Tax=Candidatus Ruania gallistercoris TaxID=2838746 RepID=A0A9D2J486_9MICO|nr:PIN domain-containing protein [Candidatus Ruania gallistercoris]